MKRAKQLLLLDLILDKAREQVGDLYFVLDMLLLLLQNQSFKQVLLLLGSLSFEYDLLNCVDAFESLFIISVQSYVYNLSCGLVFGGTGLLLLGLVSIQKIVLASEDQSLWLDH